MSETKDRKVVASTVINFHDDRKVTIDFIPNPNSGVDLHDPENLKIITMANILFGLTHSLVESNSMLDINDFVSGAIDAMDKSDV